MQKHGLCVVVVVFAILLILPILTVWAQDATPVPDYQATIDVANWQAHNARQQATAQAAIVTQQAQTTATAQAIEATGRVVEAQATTTAASHQATTQAGIVKATRAAGDVLATRTAADWAAAATATTGAYQVESTAQALRIERERIARDRDKATGALVTYLSWAGLVLAVIVAIVVANRLIDWGLGRRRRRPDGWYDVASDVIDADPGPDRRRPVPLLLLPAGDGGGDGRLMVDEAGRIWRERG